MLRVFCFVRMKIESVKISTPVPIPNTIRFNVGKQGRKRADGTAWAAVRPSRTPPNTFYINPE